MGYLDRQSDYDNESQSNHQEKLNYCDNLSNNNQNYLINSSLDHKYLRSSRKNSGINSNTDENLTKEISIIFFLKFFRKY